MKTPKADSVERIFYRKYFEDDPFIQCGDGIIREDLVSKCIDDFVLAFLEDFKKGNLKKEQIIPHIRAWFETKCHFTAGYDTVIEEAVVEKFKEKGYPDGMPVSPNPFEEKKPQEPNSRNKKTGLGCLKVFSHDKISDYVWWIIKGLTFFIGVVILLGIIFLLYKYRPSEYAWLNSVMNWF